MLAAVWLLWAMIVTLILLAIVRELGRANGRRDALRALGSLRTLRDALIAAVIAVVPTLGDGPALLGPAAFLGAVLGAGTSVLLQLWAARRRATLEAFAGERGLDLWRRDWPTRWTRADDATGLERVAPGELPGTADLLAALGRTVGPSAQVEAVAGGSISGHPALVADVRWYRRRFAAVWLDMRRDDELIARADDDPGVRRAIGLPVRVAEDGELMARVGPEGVLVLRPRARVDELGLDELATLALDLGRAVDDRGFRGGTYGVGRSADRTTAWTTVT
jgi:hypothetical protein